METEMYGLKKAIDNDDVLQLALLLNQMDIDSPCSELRGMTPLMYAINDSKTESLNLILDAGADLHGTSWRGHGPLYHAVNMQSKECIKILLEAGARPDVCLINRFFPLHEAVMKKDINTLKLFIDKGVNLDTTIADDQNALSLAASNGSAEIVSFLIHAGANINMRCPLTALEKAVFRNKWDCAKILLEAGASTTHMREAVRSLLQVSVEAESTNGENTKVVELLLKSGVDVNYTHPNTGVTALHTAFFHDNLEIATLLLNYGARIDIGSKNTPTVYQLINKNEQWKASLGGVFPGMFH